MRKKYKACLVLFTLLEFVAIKQSRFLTLIPQLISMQQEAKTPVERGVRHISRPQNLQGMAVKQDVLNALSCSSSHFAFLQAASILDSQALP